MGNDWRKLAVEKYNFKEEDFTQQTIDYITSGKVAVEGSAWGGPHGFRATEYRDKTLWLNDRNFYYETESNGKGAFFSKKGFGPRDDGKLQCVDYNYIYQQVWEEAEKKLSALKEFKDMKNKKIDEFLNNAEITYLERYYNIKKDDFIIDALKAFLINNTEYEKKIIEISIKCKSTFKKNELKHINIYLSGKTGVGKSTLINIVLGEYLAEEDVGKPVTQKTQIYSSSENSCFRFYDTKGVELENYNVNCAAETQINEIQKSLSSNNPNDFIHIIWYCVLGDGARFEDCERDLLKKLLNQYEDQSLPIIIVLTQAIDDEKNEKMKEMIQKECKDIGRNLEFVITLARDVTTKINGQQFIIPAKGLNELIDLTKKHIGNAVKSSYYESYKLMIRNEIEEVFIKELKNKKKSFLKNIEAINEIKDYDEGIKTIKNIFNGMVQEYTNYVSENIQVNSENVIDLLINKINERKNELINNYNKDLKQKIYALSNEIISSKNDIEIKIGIRLPELKSNDNYNSIFKIIEDKNKNKVELDSLRLISKKLLESVNESLTNLISKELKLGLERLRDYIHQETKDMIEKALEKIDPKIHNKKIKKNK